MCERLLCATRLVPNTMKTNKVTHIFFKKVHTNHQKMRPSKHFSLGINPQNMKMLENPFHTELCELSSTRLLHLCINWHNLPENRSYINESILQSRHQNWDFIYQRTSLQLSNGLSSLCLFNKDTTCLPAEKDLQRNQHGCGTFSHDTIQDMWLEQ